MFPSVILYFVPSSDLSIIIILLPYIVKNKELISSKFDEDVIGFTLTVTGLLLETVD